MKTSRLLQIAIVCILILSLFGPPAPAAAADASRTDPNHVLLIVVDGLRPDYVTPELMPNVRSLAQRGVVSTQHSVAYPTYTRVNSATVSTGSYPARHGLIHNTLYVPAMTPQPFSAASVKALRRLDEFTNGRMLTAVSMSDVLDRNGRRVLVASSGSAGTSLLLNPHGLGLGIWTSVGLVLPEENRDQAIKAVGEIPKKKAEQTAWVFDAYLHHALGGNPPHVTLMWISETDSAGHAHGVGAPQTLEAVKNVDRHIGRTMEALDAHGLGGRVNIFITADHGFSTTTGGFQLSGILEEHGLADQVKIVGNMIYPHSDDVQLLTRIVETLQRDTNVGNIYTRPARPADVEGVVPGTLSTDLIQWTHPRSSPIIVSPAWTDDKNEHGYAGTTTYRGTATHGSDSPFDLQVMLIAVGPDIKPGVRSNVPSGNVDLAPTILHLQGVQPLSGMDGRVMRELLRDGPAPRDVEVHASTYTTHTVLADGLRYQAELETRRVGTAVYVRSARTQRQGASSGADSR